jgi:hypothetical protein
MYGKVWLCVWKWTLSFALLSCMCTSRHGYHRPIGALLSAVHSEGSTGIVVLAANCRCKAAACSAHSFMWLHQARVRKKRVYNEFVKCEYLYTDVYLCTGKSHEKRIIRFLCDGRRVHCCNLVAKVK